MVAALRVHVILYVADQARSRDFYAAALGGLPRLDVPGMTEFEVGGCVLGLMPESGIRRLLPALDVADGAGGARVELYLVVDDPHACHARALDAGGVELSPVAPRDWGDDAGYVRDLDGHVLAFARQRRPGA